jgi:hypothetical protein
VRLHNCAKDRDVASCTMLSFLARVIGGHICYELIKWVTNPEVRIFAHIRRLYSVLCR